MMLMSESSNRVMHGSDGKIHFSCNGCGTKFVATTDQAGKSGECKNCGSPISVPLLKEEEGSKTVAEEEVKVCPECGNSLKKDARFCDNCGASTIQNTIPKAAQIKRTEGWDSLKKKYGLVKYILASVIAVWVIGTFLMDTEPNKSEKSATERKSERNQLTPPLLSEISNFLREHKEFGKPIATQSIPNWASGTRQRVTFNTGRNLLFYTKSGQVTGILEDDPIEGRKKVWGEYEKYEKFTPVARATSKSLPAYTVLSSYKKISGGKFGDILVPSFSRKTPIKTREAVFRAIAAKEGIKDVSFYSTEDAYQANLSGSFTTTHPDALRKGFLGMLKGVVFTAGESLFP